MAFFNYSSELVGFSEFPFWLSFPSIHYSISVACEFENFTSNIQCCYNCLKIWSIHYFLTSREDKRIAVEKNLAEQKDW